MKKILLAVVAFVTAELALATPETSAADLVAPSPYSYELGLSTHREVYQEFVQGRQLMEEDAGMTAIKARASRTIGDTGGAVVLSGEVGVGKSDYTGSYMDPHGSYGKLQVDNLSRTLVEVTAVYKQTSPMWNGLTVGAGLGYRRHVDNLQDAGPGGYRRVNNRGYVIVDLEQVLKFTDWNVVPGLQYKPILVSKQTSGLVGGMTVTQPRGYGAEASISFVHKRAPYTAVVTPFLRIWDLQDSEVHRTGLYEPRNKTREIGIAGTYLF